MFVDGGWVVKFAWSEPAADALTREGRLLQTLPLAAPALPLPRATVIDDPVLIVYPFVCGTTLTIDQAGLLARSDPRVLAQALAGVLALLHAPSTVAGLRAHGLQLLHPVAQADTGALRAGFPRIVDSARAEQVLRWCDWVDRTLEPPTPTMFLHGVYSSTPSPKTSCPSPVPRASTVRSWSAHRRLAAASTELARTI